MMLELIEKTVKQQNPSQKTFNRLKNKVETLQKRLRTTYVELDKSLQYYYDQIEPKKRTLAELIKEVVIISYKYYKESKLFSTQERNILKDIILDKIGDIISLSPFNSDLTPEISAIFKELEGVSYEELVKDEINHFKTDMAEEFFEQTGINIDLSAIDSSDDANEMMRKIAEAACEGFSEMESKAAPKPKSKKQQERELKAQKLETLQKEGLNSIYKQLAKAFHPDLEQDPEQRIAKQELMKKLTTAYDNKDLHTLLSLEMEWMNGLDKENKRQTENQLKIYNSLLKEQINTLEGEIEMAILHPKYLPIHSYVAHSPASSFFILAEICRELKGDISNFQMLLTSLQSKQAEKTILGIIQQLY